jgi:hypothetical protein
MKDLYFEGPPDDDGLPAEGRINYSPKYSAILESHLSSLLLTFYTPRVSMSLETGEISIDYKWTLEEARKQFEHIKELYIEAKKKESLPEAPGATESTPPEV